MEGVKAARSPGPFFFLILASIPEALEASGSELKLAKALSCWHWPIAQQDKPVF